MPRHPLYESPKPGMSLPVKTPAPKASRAFPANVDGPIPTRSGPPVRAERPPVKNMFNRDSGAVSKRPAMTPPSRVR